MHHSLLAPFLIKFSEKKATHQFTEDFLPERARKRKQPSLDGVTVTAFTHSFALRIAAFVPEKYC